MGEKLGEKNLGEHWETAPGFPLPDMEHGYEFVLLKTHDSGYRTWKFRRVGDGPNFSNQAPYWLRRQEEQKTITGARSGVKADKTLTEIQDEKYAEWFEKEYNAVTRPMTAGEECIREYDKHASNIELKIKVAELQRSNKFLWVIVIFNAVMGIVFGSRDLFGW